MDKTIRRTPDGKPERPRDWQSRLKTWQRSQKPTLWQRILKRAGTRHYISSASICG